VGCVQHLKKVGSAFKCTRVVSSFSKLQNIPGLKVEHAKIFNFSLSECKLSNSTSRDSGDSPDSNHTKYINYECLDLKEIGVIFPSLRDA
jgi:hypothetical protein